MSAVSCPVDGDADIQRQVDALLPISLDDLVEQASLQTRIDRKYVLPLSATAAIVVALGTDATALEIGGERRFAYESIYYDTPDLTSYHLSARGRRRRFKIRLRTYLGSGLSYVEVKTCGARGTTVKERFPLSAGPHDEAILSVEDFIDDALGRAGVDKIDIASLRPTLRTRYARSTLFLPATSSRVTVDTDLTWALPGGDAARVRGVTVVETKSGTAASVADRALWAAGHRPNRISKYGTGLAALRDDLPDNRWHPVLRRQLTSCLPAPVERPHPALRGNHDWTLPCPS